MATKKFYIGERLNPQLPKSYFNAYGQLSKAEAKKKENTAYGLMILTGYNSKSEYENRLEELKRTGYSVYA